MEQNCEELEMKFYEIHAAHPESAEFVIEGNIQYRSLAQSIQALESILVQREADLQKAGEDRSFTLVRVSDKKEKKKKGQSQEVPLVQTLCGLDEDTNTFCYEGIYFMSQASDFERIILTGQSNNAWIGKYGVRIDAAAQGEFCFFSDLEMILESIKELCKKPEQIVNRVLTLVRKSGLKETEVMAQLLYTPKEDGGLQLQSHLKLSSADQDRAMLERFIEEHPTR